MDTIPKEILGVVEPAAVEATVLPSAQESPRLAVLKGLEDSDTNT